MTDEVRAEMDRLVTHLVFESGATMADLHTTRAGFPSAAVAGLYGSASSDGASPVELGEERAGILTRAALLYSADPETSPVHRGLRVMESLVCLSVPPPSPSSIPPDSIVPPAFDPNKTARERWADQTGEQPCAGCHNQINAYGFAFEGYDTLGRSRSEEEVIDPDTQMVVNTLPVDSRVTVDLGNRSLVSVDGAVGLSAAVAEHAAARDCFSRQWLRFVEGRETVRADDQVIAALAQMVGEASLLEAMRAIAMTEQFRLRRHTE